MFVELNISNNTPNEVRNFIKNQIKMQFEDVHALLRLPIKQLADPINAGCNFATATIILSLISGLSAMLDNNFDTSNKSKKLFKQVLEKYYPWNLQPPIGGTNPNNNKKQAIGDLYTYIRNPLSHSLGVKKQNTHFIYIYKDTLSEKDIEKIEKSLMSPGPAIIYTSNKWGNESRTGLNLYVSNLYWGVRKLLKNMTDDLVLMNKLNQTIKNFNNKNGPLAMDI
jgi:hypothetical protein